MSLSLQIEEDLRAAFVAKRDDELQVLRLLKARLQNRAIELKIEQAKLADDEVLKILKSEAKSRKDAIQTYQEKGLADLVAKEESEVVILDKYLPAQISEADVRPKVEQAIATLGEQANFGAVMKQVMAELGAQADGQVVSKIVKELLG